MTEITHIQLGDIVRIRETITLVPLYENVPAEIPAGIYGEVVSIAEDETGETIYYVDFHEPYEFVSELGIHGDMLEVVFRLPIF
jgi:hypothetical protein